ncbi:GNAT family N-acetyltransferase [Oceanobacillus sp. 1P07AA]|uniref:GNAT family N-acetyltransferase n=1 Tax=Oceanobacillus sp. 1P07AA TaxID=3132293 RepID=UPI0039A66585
MQIMRANEYNDQHVREKFSKTFVDGFGEDLRYFAEDKEKLAKALKHMFVLENFYIAVVDEDIAAITFCSDGDKLAIQHNQKELRKHLGWLKGTIANVVFKKEFQKPPVKKGEKIANVGFVATAEKYRRKGIASTLIDYILSLPQYETFLLETIADTNIGALQLYKNLGFKEIKRTKQKHTTFSGIHYYIDMAYKRNE